MRAGIKYFLLLSAALLVASPVAGKGAARSLDRLLPEIRRHTPGTFYDADGPYPGPNQQSFYRIKWMTPDGRIIWLQVDARNGHVLGLAPRQSTGPGQNSGPVRGDERRDERYEYPPVRSAPPDMEDGPPPGPGPRGERSAPRGDRFGGREHFSGRGGPQRGE